MIQHMRIIDAFCVIGNPQYGGTSATMLMEDMQRNGIEKAVIVPDDSYAAVHNEDGNRLMLHLMEHQAGPFIGFASVNPWYGQKASKMLKSFLNSGLRGVYFKSTVQGFMPDDEMLSPLLDICAEKKVPAYFHTGTPVNALPFTVMSQAKRYPAVNFILGHMGANDYVGDAYAAVKSCENVYLETSYNLTLLIRNAANIRADRVLFGSGTPRSRMEFELKKTREAILDDKILELVLFCNMERVLGDLE